MADSECICTLEKRSTDSLHVNGRSWRNSPPCPLKGGWLLVAGRTPLPCADVTARRRGFSTAAHAVSETKPAQVTRDSLALFMNAYPDQTGTQFKKKVKYGHDWADKNSILRISGSYSKVFRYSLRKTSYTHSQASHFCLCNWARKRLPVRLHPLPSRICGGASTALEVLSEYLPIPASPHQSEMAQNLTS